MNTVKKPTAKRLRAWLRFLYECKVHPETLLEVSSDCRKFGYGLFVVGAVGGIVELDKINSSEAAILSFAGLILWLGGCLLASESVNNKKSEGAKKRWK